MYYVAKALHSLSKRCFRTNRSTWQSLDRCCELKVFVHTLLVVWWKWLGSRDLACASSKTQVFWSLTSCICASWKKPEHRKNDFDLWLNGLGCFDCAQLPSQWNQRSGPWLCSAGRRGSGFLSPPSCKSGTRCLCSPTCSWLCCLSSSRCESLC